MKILITGGAGYVGSACLRYVAAHGHEVLAYDNLSQGHERAVARQGLVSAFSHADPGALPAFDADSAFQKRMLREDWVGGLVPRLESRAAEVDVLVWDLCD